MDALTLSQILFLRKLIAAYERERQVDNPAYQAALVELDRLEGGSTDSGSSVEPSKKALQFPARRQS